VRYWLGFALLMAAIVVMMNFRVVSESYVGCRLVGHPFDVCVIGALGKADL
jgi:hypothetical protein